MSIPFGALAGVAIAALVLKGKNEVEVVAITNSDEFTLYDNLFKKYALIENVDWGMLKALAMNESSLGAAASVKRGIASPSDIEGSKSSDGKSWGLMQMTIPTLRDFDIAGSPEKLNNPEYSIKYAAKFVRSLGRQWPIVDNRWEEFVVKSYNQGAGNTRKEMNGEIEGYAEAYWERYQRNRQIVRDKQGV